MAVHIATCRFISKVFPSGRERSFLRPPISRAHRHSHVNAHAPTCRILCVQSFLATVAKHLLFVPSGGVWSLSLWALHYIGDVRCARFAVSVSLEPAREVACKDCTAPTFFSVRAMFSLSSFWPASLIWRRSRTDVPGFRRCDILWSLVLRIVFVYEIYFVKNMAVIKC